MLILDVQGFQSPMNEFIVKELAVQALHNNDCACLLFEPPCEWSEQQSKYRKTNQWLIKNHHGLPWEAGFISYAELQDTITQIIDDASIIFVNGLEKKQWLESYTDKLVINLNDLGASKAKNRKAPGCWIHRENSIITKNYTCAFENCRKLADWYKSYFPTSLHSSLSLHEWIKDTQVIQPDSAHLMKSFLLNFASQHIDELWEALPERLQRMDDLQQHRR